jgi:hypothetical protein
MRKLYRLWEIVKIWKRRAQPPIPIDQSREQEIERVANNFGVLAANRARAITLIKAAHGEGKRPQD